MIREWHDGCFKYDIINKLRHDRNTDKDDKQSKEEHSDRSGDERIKQAEREGRGKGKGQNFEY